MNRILPVLLVAALAFTAGSAIDRGQTVPPDPRGMDHDGDSAITILDLTLMASHFLEQVGPPDPCVTFVYYSTPRVQMDGGTVVGEYSAGVIIPSDHPALARTPAALRPC